MITLGPFRARRFSRAQDAPAPHAIATPLVLLGDHDTISRHEPDSFAVRAIARDPYAAWVEQREAEREGHQAIRWVYRQREQELSAAR
jgi:hypothetical protein